MYATPVIVFLCSVVALGLSCCTPDQWEAEESVIGGFADRRRHGLLKEFIAISYDAANNRTAAFLEYRSREHSNKFKIVTRYDNGEGKVYVLDLKRDKCWTKRLERPFRRACIPPDAKSVGSYYLGLRGGFQVTGYEVHGPRINVFVSVQNTGNGQCIPVSEAVYGKMNKVEFIQTVGFINVTPGIKNETVFNIPRKCERNDNFSMAEELTRDHYIMAV